MCLLQPGEDDPQAGECTVYSECTVQQAEGGGQSVGCQ